MARDIALLFVGIFIGAAMSPFLTPGRAIVSGALACSFLVFVYAPRAVRELHRPFGPWLLRVTCVLTFAISWSALTFLLRDRRPTLTYSLTALTADEAAPFLNGAEWRNDGAFYRFVVRNLGPADVTYLHINVDLPNYLTSVPTIIDMGHADEVSVKPAFMVLTTKASPKSPAVRVPGFTNSGIVEAKHLLAGGMLDVGFFALDLRGMCLTDGKGARYEGDRYGEIAVSRRHAYYNEEINDKEAFPIVDVVIGRELLDTTRSAENISVFGPPVGADSIPVGGLVTMEYHGE